MRLPRIYHPSPINIGDVITLTDEAAHHLRHVLRLKTGQSLLLFIGDNRIFHAELIENSGKRALNVKILSEKVENRESSLDLHLGQVISRGEKMTFTLQKAVELGVNTITPLYSERCGVKLNDLRQEKKFSHWQKIVIAACEQCGRNTIPEIRPGMKVNDWCAENEKCLKLNLHPRAQKRVQDLPNADSIRLLIGPEGGLSSQEITMTQKYGFIDVLLGPRILRTETAALAAITALQMHFGDL